MLDGEAEVFVEYAGAGARCCRRNYDEAAVDLLPPVHARGILLTDEAAFGEAHSVQLRRVAFEPEDVAELRAALADAQAEPVLQPAVSRLVPLAEPSSAKLVQARGDVDAMARDLLRRAACLAPGEPIPQALLVATLGMPQLNPVNEQFRRQIDARLGRGYEHTYLYPGIRKVVQAAGRVIRTPEDRGIVYLIIGWLAFRFGIGGTYFALLTIAFAE